MLSTLLVDIIVRDFKRSMAIMWSMIYVVMTYITIAQARMRGWQGLVASMQSGVLGRLFNVHFVVFSGANSMVDTRVVRKEILTPSVLYL